MYDSFEILSVDDNLVNHIVVENSLVPRGYKVTTCMSGQDALSLIETRGFLPDLILLDCMMPNMSGCEMCEKLRESYPCNTLPVIMVSAKDQEDDIVAGLKSGCNDYLAKPYGVNELNARIDVQLKLKYLWHLEIQRMLSERAAILQLPAGVEEARQLGEMTVHDGVSVLICDVEDLLNYLHRLPAHQIADLINLLYDAFDKIALEEEASRVLDDSYMLLLGGDEDPGDQAMRIIDIANKMMAEAQKIKVVVEGKEEPLRLRMGIARGKAYSAMVGMKLAYYTYFGQAVREGCSACTVAPDSCVLVTDEIRSVLPYPDTFTVPYPGLTTEKGPLHIAKIGRFEEALEERPMKMAGAEEGGGDVLKTGGAAQEVEAMTHLRAFLRLSVAHAKGKGGQEGGGGGGEGERELEGAEIRIVEQCTQCEAWAMKFHTLEEELRVAKGDLKKLSGEVAVNELTGQAGNSQTFSQETLQRQQSYLHKRDPKEIEILSVDDDPVNQMVVENLLTPLGYIVTTCMDGMEALQHISRCPQLPDLVLLDVMMPEISGLQVCQRLREMYNRTSLPVIMVSAKSSVENIVEGLEAGCNDYVSKPFNRVELLARISTQLRVRDAARAEVNHVRSAKLLQKMLPEHVIAKLTTSPSMIVEEHRGVSMLFACIIGYSTLSATLPTMELIQMLNQLNTSFDDLCDKHGCYKVGTSEDTYTVVAGHDAQSADHHADNLARMAIDMLEAVRHIQYPRHPGKHMQVRIGIHSGSAYAGVVGHKMLRYCFFGDAVTIAQNMGHTGFAMNIQVSEATEKELNSNWELVEVGQRHVKDQGAVKAFVIKDPACAWQSAVEKAKHMKEEENIPRINSSQASFSLARQPQPGRTQSRGARLSVASGVSDMEQQVLHDQIAKVVSDGGVDIDQLAERLAASNAHRTASDGSSLMIQSDDALLALHVQETELKLRKKRGAAHGV